MRFRLGTCTKGLFFPIIKATIEIEIPSPHCAQFKDEEERGF